MGGNLLKNWGLPDKRLTTKELLETKVYLESIFAPYGHVDMAHFVEAKETHGDIDLLFAPFDGKFDTTNFIKKVFNAPINANSNVRSFPLNGFQVDVVVLSDKKAIESYKNYSSWGDLGNILGRIFYKLGLRYGHSGLSFWIRSHNGGDCEHIYEKCVLTQDMREILELVGLNYQKWFNGFKTNQDIYDFVAESQYFDPQWFSFDSLNHIDRVRNKKRAMYCEFIEYLRVKKYDKKVAPLSKEEFLKQIFKKYPYLSNRIDYWKKEELKIMAIKDKINGNLVRSILPNIPVKSIGEIIKFVKDNYDVTQLPDVEIVRIVQQYYGINYALRFNLSKEEMKRPTVFNIPRYAAREFKTYLDPKDFAWISIGEPDDKNSIISNSILGAAETLKIQFWDITEPIEYKDEILQPISTNQVQQIVDFLVANFGKSIIVNCAAGVSRSGAIAQFCHDMFEYEWNNGCRECAMPNNFIYKEMVRYYTIRYKNELNNLKIN